MALARPRGRVAAAAAHSTGDGRPAVGGGLGAGAAITVKGATADAQQRDVIDKVLSTGRQLGCSRRVMVACVMAVTQESAARPLGYGDAAGPDSRGPFQQRASWGPVAQRRDPAAATRLFLTVDRGPGVQGWRVVHGSLTHAPADLGRAVQKVQGSAFPDAYRRWEAEATRTVATWLGGDAASQGGADPAAGRYVFQRGERGGQPESSWDAMGRLAEEVRWARWAAGNTLFFVSEQELLRAAPSLVIRGGEPWIQAGPSWEWQAATPVTEISMDVLVDEWPVMPGAVVRIDMGSPIDGRWIVSAVSNALSSPVASITLRRPTLRAAEPASDATQDAAVGDAGGGLAADGGGMFEACKRIHEAAPGYRYGAGHGGPITTAIPGELDCSSSTSWALAIAGLGFRVGQPAKVSGAIAAEWGAPGRGRSFTVWADAQHVWVEFHGRRDGWARFDTSPHGDRHGRGPRLRTTVRGDHDRFTARHWPGL